MLLRKPSLTILIPLLRMKHSFVRNLDIKHTFLPKTNRRLLSKRQIVSNPPWQHPLSTHLPPLCLLLSLRIILLATSRLEYRTQQLAVIRVDLMTGSKSRPVLMAVLSHHKAPNPMEPFNWIPQASALSRVPAINAPTANQPSPTHTSSSTFVNPLKRTY